MDKQDIRLMVKKELHEQVEGEPLEESTAVFGGMFLTGVILLWKSFRESLKRANDKKIVSVFLESVDPRGLLVKKTEALLKSFRTIRTENDLNLLERDIDKLIKQYEEIIKKVDKFNIENALGPEKDGSQFGSGFRNQMLAINPRTERQRLKEFLKKFISNMKIEFEMQVDAKKKELFM